MPIGESGHVSDTEITREKLSCTGRRWDEEITRNLGISYEGGVWHEFDGAGEKVI